MQFGYPSIFLFRLPQFISSLPFLLRLSIIEKTSCEFSILPDLRGGTERSPGQDCDWLTKIKRSGFLSDRSTSCKGKNQKRTLNVRTSSAFYSSQTSERVRNEKQFPLINNRNIKCRQNNLHFIIVSYNPNTFTIKLIERRFNGIEKCVFLNAVPYRLMKL